MPWVPGLNVRILTHERARVGRQAVVDALLELVRRRKLAGITVTRALEGYSRHGGMRSSGVVELGDDLPLIVQITDRADRIEAALPEIASMVSSGVLSVTDARVYFPATSLVVRDVMSPPELVVRPETPVGEALRALLERGIRMIPVVSASNALAGIVTLGHLLQAVDPTLATDLLRLRSPDALRARLEGLIARHTVGESLLSRPFVLDADQPLDSAARALTAQELTRAPVVESGGRLVGVLGERDVVAALVGPLTSPAPGETTQQLRAVLRTSVSPARGAPVTAGGLAERDVPTLEEDAPLERVVQATQESASGVVLVVDSQRRLRGVIDEHALLLALAPGTPPGVGAALRHLARFAPRRSVPPSGGAPERPRDASAVMRASRVIVPEEMPAAEALAEMMQAQHTDVAVVMGRDDVPVGLLTRQAALRSLVGG